MKEKKKLMFSIGWKPYTNFKLFSVDLLNFDGIFTTTIFRLQIFKFIIDIFVDTVEV